jgi:hypothetical protein
MNWYL